MKLIFCHIGWGGVTLILAYPSHLICILSATPYIVLATPHTLLAAPCIVWAAPPIVSTIQSMTRNIFFQISAITRVGG